MSRHPLPLTRREALKLAASAALASGVHPSLEAWAQDAPRFFTPEELEIVDALSDLIIPTDEHSPGAHAAGVAPFVDAMLAAANPAYAEEGELRRGFKAGLQSAAAACLELNGATFADCSPSQRERLLRRLSEAGEKTPEGDFFALLKEWTVDAYYSSEIGIHQELGYKGNAVQGDFAGELPVGPARSAPDAEAPEGGATHR